MSDPSMETGRELAAEETERAPLTPIQTLKHTRDSLQKTRIGVGNRLNAITRGVDDMDDDITNAYRRLHTALEEWETQIDKLIVHELPTFPVWDYWLRHVKGVGPGLAAQLLSLLHHPLEDRGPSTWTKAAGMNPSPRPDGTTRLPRPRAGEGAIQYHPGLRKSLYLVGQSFVRTGGYYRTIYEQRKARVLAQHSGEKDWPLHRIDSVARWMTIRLFLCHLWEKWLECEGKTGRRAYVLDVLKHTHYIAPPEPVKGQKI